MSDRPEIRIRLQANQSLQRVNEPITCGVPFPKGRGAPMSDLRMYDSAGRSIPLQTKVLDHWPDGSPRWLLCDWQATTGAGNYVLRSEPGSAEATAQHIVSLVESDAEAIHLDTDAISLFFEQGTPLFLAGAVQPHHQHPMRADLLIEDATHHGVTSLEQHELSTFGPLRSSVTFHGESRLPGFLAEEIFVEVTCFAGLPTVRCRLIVGNAKAADHPGGLWDLGNAGSKFLKEAKFRFAFDRDAKSKPRTAHCSAEPGHVFESLQLPFELYQDSSGGPNWRSSNHIYRNRVVSSTIQGYRLKSGDAEKTGLRATPIVTLDHGNQHLAVSMPYFWQNFPKAIEADERSITLSLFPRQHGDLHEIQGGEQKTHVFYVSFGRDRVTAEPLAWTRDPLIPVVDPQWVASTGVVPYLTADGHDTSYLQLVDAAIEGEDTFEKKREVIDEFGWRHFGDIYGDHEAVFHKGPTPLISHYNNQYDAVAGMIYQFLRSGDVRWKKLADELAAHVIDIDIYHTDLDKAAYNNGLFWHTYHYVDADTGTHRSYPKNGRIPPDDKPVPGGGPANEQNYSTGLMLHYFLTGEEASKDAAIDLAQWVIDMDDGSQTPFRWLASGSTGLASQSRTPDYHGPGRGAANSISVLLDGHRLTGDRKFLAKAEQLIRRCIHPADNLTDRNLLDAENRWFYTMFLQSLGKYLDYKADLGEFDVHYTYARASLLHYARWMAEHEYPYLEKSELLEYPTETWAAQDMRKCEVFQFAAMHAEGAERERFQERAEFFFQYSVNKLLSMPTRTLCRPVVLMLSNGFSRAWHKANPDAKAPLPEEIADFGKPEQFVPQKQVAIRRFKQLVIVVGLVGLIAVAALIYWIVR